MFPSAHWACCSVPRAGGAPQRKCSSGPVTPSQRIIQRSHGTVRTFRGHRVTQSTDTQYDTVRVLYAAKQYDYFIIAEYALGSVGGDSPISRFLCRFLCVICTSARFHEPRLCVRRSQQVTGSRSLKTRVLTSTVLFVTLSKSKTYKETIVRVLVPQSLVQSCSDVLIAKLIIVLVLYGIADYASWWAGGDSPIS